MKRAWIVTPFLLGLLSFPALADDEERKVADWSPSWKVGDAWTIKTFQKDLSERLASPRPLDRGGGGVPRLPKSPTGAPIPGFPPLRKGIPRGYKTGNTFRFKVARQETIRFADDTPIDTKPEKFWVVEVRTIGGGTTRRAELYYATHDLVLSKVVLQGRDDRKDREVWLKGSVQLALPVSQELGFPLDWPDLRAARKPRVRFRLADRPPVEQRVRIDKERTPDERIRVLLQQKPDKGKSRSRALFLFKRGQPFWSRIDAGMFFARMVESGDK